MNPIGTRGGATSPGRGRGPVAGAGHRRGRRGGADHRWRSRPEEGPEDPAGPATLPRPAGAAGRRHPGDRGGRAGPLPGRPIRPPFLLLIS